jgi:hypothetical protein
MQTLRRRYWVYFWLLAACVFLFPINNGPLRYATVVTSVIVFVAAVYWFRKQKPVFYGLILAAALTVIFLALPGKKAEPEKLTKDYLEALRSYEGTRYIWGGENKLGIDCSGLVRAGLIKANFRQGILTLNPNLVRFSFSLWWHDCSAKALGEGYREQTKHLLWSPSINALDETKILPGDIAVTKSEVHVLAFLGNNEWIEADPDVRRVVIVQIPAANNPWFDEPVQILRWTQLESK